MTNPTPHGQVHEALEDHQVRKLAAIGAVSTSSGLVERRPIEYRRELEDQFVRGFRAAEKRLSALRAQQPAPAANEVVAHRVMRKNLEGEWTCDGRHWYDGAPSKELVDSICADKTRWRVDLAYAALQPSPTAQADSQPAPVQSGLVATMLDALRHAQTVLNHNNLHLECGPVNAAILAARAPADSVTEPAAGVVAGWKLAPVEPTDAMVQAAHHIDLSYMPGQEGADRAAIYRAMLTAAPTPPTHAADSALKDHQIAALVNELRDIAVEFHGAQQLRERIAQAVVPVLKAKAADSVLEDAHALLQEVAACFTRDDDLPDNLLPRIDAVLAARRQGGAT